MKFFLLSLIGALVYHAIQVRQFMSSPWGLFIPARTSFLDIFLKTIAEPIEIPALQTLSGPMNLLIGGAIGCAVALVVHFLQPRGASGLQPHTQAASARRVDRPESSTDLDEEYDADLDEGETDEAVDSPPAPEPRIVRNTIDARPSRFKPGQVVMIAVLIGAFGYLGFLMLGAQHEANGAAHRPSESKPLPVLVSDLSGEWFNEYSGGRTLRLRGALFNYEGNGESFEQLDCAVALRVHFDDGRDAIELKGRTCSFANTIARGEYKTFDDIFGTTVERKWLDYDVARVEIRIEVGAKNPFGERFSTEMPWTDIPLPSIKTRFSISTTAL